MIDWLMGVFGFWGTYIFITLLSVLLSSTIALLYQFSSGWLDRHFPDNLPLHAGAWVKAELQKRGLSTRVKVIPMIGGPKTKVTDAFFPSSNQIILKAETYFKKDPGFWAVGAHELGHALIHQKSALFSSILLVARLGYKLLASLGGMLLLVNLLYGSVEISLYALSLVRFGIWLFLVVLLEEFFASLLALSILRVDDRLSRGQWWGAFSVLLVAFFTYLGEFAGQLIILSQTQFFIKYFVTHKDFVASPPVSDAGWFWVILLLIVLLSRGFVLLKGLFGKIVMTTPAQRLKMELGTGAAVMLLLWLIWPYSGTSPYIIAVMLALFSARLFWGLILSPVLIVLAILFMLLLLPLFLLVFFLFRSSWVRSAPAASIPVNQDELREGQRELIDSQRELAQNPPWYVRLDPLRQAAFLPLCALLLSKIFS